VSKHEQAGVSQGKISPNNSSFLSHHVAWPVPSISDERNCRAFAHSAESDSDDKLVALFTGRWDIQEGMPGADYVFAKEHGGFRCFFRIGRFSRAS